jgi:hypothetical protein
VATIHMTVTMTADENRSDSQEPQKTDSTPAIPDYLADPNAVFSDEGVQWRYGRAPDYTKTRKVWAEGERRHSSLGALVRRRDRPGTQQIHGHSMCPVVPTWCPTSEQQRKSRLEPQPFASAGNQTILCLGFPWRRSAEVFRPRGGVAEGCRR